VNYEGYKAAKNAPLIERMKELSAQYPDGGAIGRVNHAL